NVPRLRPFPGEIVGEGKPGERRTPLADDVVHHAGQHLAVVVADTLERATHAASLVRVAYEERTPPLALKLAVGSAFPPTHLGGTEAVQVRRGDVGAALAAAAVKLEHTYETPVLHHNPIETGVTIASWDGDRLTIHESTRWVLGARMVVAHVVGVPE